LSIVSQTMPSASRSIFQAAGFGSFIGVFRPRSRCA
jgi:hypothetical protein